MKDEYIACLDGLWLFVCSWRGVLACKNSWCILKDAIKLRTFKIRSSLSLFPQEGIAPVHLATMLNHLSIAKMILKKYRRVQDPYGPPGTLINHADLITVWTIIRGGGFWVGSDCPISLYPSVFFESIYVSWICDTVSNSDKVSLQDQGNSLLHLICYMGKQTPVDFAGELITTFNADINRLNLVGW